VLEVKEVFEASSASHADLVRQNVGISERNDAKLDRHGKLLEQHKDTLQEIHQLLSDHMVQSIDEQYSIAQRLDSITDRLYSDAPPEEVNERRENTEMRRNMLSRAQEKLKRDCSFQVGLRAKLRPACPPRCGCQCHRYTQMRTPSWLRSIVGSLYVKYNTFFVFSQPPCNSKLCRSRVSSLDLPYCFPTWALARVIAVTIANNSLLDIGCSLHLRVPRLVKWPRGFFDAFEYKDVQFFRDSISAGQLFPTDVDSLDGGSVIMVRSERYSEFTFEHNIAHV
jgi:hypothetical protein